MTERTDRRALDALVREAHETLDRLIAPRDWAAPPDKPDPPKANQLEAVAREAAAARSRYLEFQMSIEENR